MMSNIAGLEEQAKLDTTKAQVEVLSALGDLMDKFKLPREEWIDFVFRRYMHLPNSFIDVLATSLPLDVQVQESNRQAVPRSATLMRMLEAELSKQGYDPGRVKTTLHEMASSLEKGGKTARYYPQKYRRLKNDDFTFGQLAEGEIIQSSFGNVEQPFKVALKKDGSVNTISAGQPLNESAPVPAYRQYGPLAE